MVRCRFFGGSQSRHEPPVKGTGLRTARQWAQNSQGRWQVSGRQSVKSVSIDH